MKRKKSHTGYERSKKNMRREKGMRRFREKEKEAKREDGDPGRGYGAKKGLQRQSSTTVMIFAGVFDPLQTAVFEQGKANRDDQSDHETTQQEEYKIQKHIIHRNILLAILKSENKYKSNIPPKQDKGVKEGLFHQNA